MRFFYKGVQKYKNRSKEKIFQTEPAMEISETDSGKEEMDRQTWRGAKSAV